MSNLDLTKLSPMLARGERVVIIMPSAEPVVLLPLAEYEKLLQSVPAEADLLNQAGREPVLEDISPLAGSVADDDQYYPEPL